ncbi:MAG: tRNA epoxyqueuosine(34) reductase QueG, partial [Burkholderiales bacterium]
MLDYTIITQAILNKALSFGFLEAKIAQIKIDASSQNNFTEWLQQNFHGEMEYLARNTELRFNPELLHEGTLSIICVKAPYLTKPVAYHKQRLDNKNLAYISSYALGRDYHKVVKGQLKKYAAWINHLIAGLDFTFNYRAFTDSAPVLEVELAKNAGLGFRGKNTLLLHKTQGSLFFLGEIFTNLPLIANNPTTSHCGSCTKCLTA